MAIARTFVRPRHAFTTRLRSSKSTRVAWRTVMHSLVRVGQALKGVNKSAKV